MSAVIALRRLVASLPQRFLRHVPKRKTKNEAGQYRGPRVTVELGDILRGQSETSAPFSLTGVCRGHLDCGRELFRRGFERL